MADVSRRGKVLASSWEVYCWPEFKAFAERLGIAYDAPTVRLVVVLGEPNEPVKIEHSYAGSDAQPLAPFDGGPDMACEVTACQPRN
jgi:hypothetical protein